jgi:hypothetical protein
MCSAIKMGRCRKYFDVRGAQASSRRPPRHAEQKGHAGEGAQEAKWRTFGAADNKINGEQIRRATA